MPTCHSHVFHPVEGRKTPNGGSPTTAALLKIGFVGVTFVEDEYAVLIDLSAAAPNPSDDASSDANTGIVRLLPGDTLSDGRTLAAITPAALTLAAPDGERQVLRLFGDWTNAP